MGRAMGTLQDLIEEAKVRTVCWAICVFAISYILTHTSKSMWTNIPISVLILAAFRYLSYEVELRLRVRPAPKPTYLSHLQQKELTLDDFRLSTVPPSGWRSKIDSPSVEAAIEGFIDKILQDFVLDLWYSSITPDKEAPELIRAIILDALGEVSARVKDFNLVDLLTRDLVDLIGNQLDLYRKNQSEIGAEIMATLSFEERDERLKQHLMAAKELHPALYSTESEYKVLQRIVGGILTIVLKSQEAQSPLVHCIARELLTCLVLQPVMNFASPWYINELIEYMLLNNKGSSNDETDLNKSSETAKFIQNSQSSVHDSQIVSTNEPKDLALLKDANQKSLSGLVHSHSKTLQKDTLLQHASTKLADWAVGLDAATKRRTEVLAPENLENMWTKGTHYQKKTPNLIKSVTSPGTIKDLNSSENIANDGSLRKESVTNLSESIKGMDEKYMVHLMHESMCNERNISLDMVEHRKEKTHFSDEYEENSRETGKTTNKVQLKESYSISHIDARESGESAHFVDNYGPNYNHSIKEQISELVSHGEGSSHVPKVRCRIVGAYFEKIGSKSFAVYSIAVTDAENKTWFVKRRYRNFERLHRQLKDIPNYSLHLPPKRFLSSSVDDYFVHQRCIHLDKYLQDLLSIPNVAEQHEVWDFLSVSSKNYSFGKSTSVMKTLAVNVDDVMDDMLRQFKGVSDGLRKVVGTPSNIASSASTKKTLTLSWNEEEIHKQMLSFSNVESTHSLSDDDDHDGSQPNNSGWHSDNELKSKNFSPRYVKHNEESSTLRSQRSIQSDKSGRISLDGSKASVASDSSEDPDGIPPEWTPTNVSVPMLNLVDKIFQLNGRGWLRRQVYWIAKQILQLMMEDAIDDWILRQIHSLRRGDVIVQGIHWVQDVLWPNGVFFTRIDNSEGNLDDIKSNRGSSQTTSRMGDTALRARSFELQLEAARRASDVKKMILGGAPATLVSLIGPSQYKRSAKDVYFFVQSNICIKQLAYSILEMVLVSVFPEMQSLILDIHENGHGGVSK